MQPSPRSPLVVVAAVLTTLTLVVTGWLLGHGGGTTPAAVAATGSGDASGDRARDGVLVSGTGEVMGRPDTLVAQFGAEATAGSVDEALARADRAIGRITDVLTKGGVDDADLQTAGLDIYPQYSGDGRQVTGYQAQQQLTVTFRDVDAAGRLVGRAVSAGGDAARLSGLSFRVDDDSALLADARRKAFDDAKDKAQLYGDAAGRGLGRVVSVTETVTGTDNPYPTDMYLARADAAGARDVNLQPGQQQLSVTVTVEWSFG
jgi:uncharacterized protein YggE